MVWSPFEKIILFLSVNVLGAFRLREKVYEIFFRKFFKQKLDVKIKVTLSPLLYFTVMSFILRKRQCGIFKCALQYI